MQVFHEIDKINLIAKKYDLIVMDCAQSYSSYYKGFACGSKADLATTVFTNKNYNAGGEGGALVVNNKRMVERAYKKKD